MKKLAPARRAHAARQIEPAGVRAREAVVERSRHREENDEHGHRYRGGHAVTELEHQHRRHCKDRHRLARNQHQFQPQACRPDMGDHQRGKCAKPITKLIRISASVVLACGRSRLARSASAAERASRPGRMNGCAPAIDTTSFQKTSSPAATSAMRSAALMP